MFSDMAVREHISDVCDLILGLLTMPNQSWETSAHQQRFETSRAMRLWTRTSCGTSRIDVSHW